MSFSCSLTFFMWTFCQSKILVGFAQHRIYEICWVKIQIEVLCLRWANTKNQFILLGPIYLKFPLYSHINNKKNLNTFHVKSAWRKFNPHKHTIYKIKKQLLFQKLSCGRPINAHQIVPKRIKDQLARVVIML